MEVRPRGSNGCFPSERIAYPDRMATRSRPRSGQDHVTRPRLVPLDSNSYTHCPRIKRIRGRALEKRLLTGPLTRLYSRRHRTVPSTPLDSLETRRPLRPSRVCVSHLRTSSHVTTRVWPQTHSTLVPKRARRGRVWGGYESGVLRPHSPDSETAASAHTQSRLSVLSAVWVWSVVGLVQLV